MAGTKPDKIPAEYIPKGYEFVGIYPVRPMGKPRQSQRDKYKPRKIVQRWRSYSTAIQLQGNKQGLRGHDAADKLPTSGLHLLAFIAPPKSRRDDVQYWTECKEKPDFDNIAKGFFDSIFYNLRDNTGQSIDDKIISDCQTTKIWAPVACQCLILLRKTTPTLDALAPIIELTKKTKPFDSA